MMINNMPSQGDLIWVDSEPRAIHGYGGHDPEAENTFRPMLVMSDAALWRECLGSCIGKKAGAPR
ncbi:MAG: hypothetical protein LKI92_07785 [Schleiferilactobacillus harbinensis]|jgi:mRNA interferase MazF|nr:hypothetical protein [Schleiferilactobacillus harbinensis]MCI1913107.1 hypothetical protein [Schleiferilactobacillus harbinensis]